MAEFWRFPLFFGPEGFPADGFVTPTGQLGVVNVLVPVDEVNLEHALPAPDGSGGSYVAVTFEAADLLKAVYRLLRGLEGVSATGESA